MPTRYAHTNLIADDWRRVADFYIEVFDCVPVSSERDHHGPLTDELTAMPGARIRGRHLRLPGHGDNGPTLGESHMQWQLNEINKLIWPSPAGVGVLDQALWDQTVAVAVEGEIITEPPTEGAYRTDLAQAAVDSLKAEGVDVTGESWEPVTVELKEGGQ